MPAVTEKIMKRVRGKGRGWAFTPKDFLDLGTRARVAPDASLARFHLEHAEAAQFDALAALHPDAHRVEHRIDGNLGLDLGDVGGACHLVDDVSLDHEGSLGRKEA